MSLLLPYHWDTFNPLAMPPNYISLNPSALPIYNPLAGSSLHVSEIIFMLCFWLQMFQEMDLDEDGYIHEKELDKLEDQVFDLNVHLFSNERANKK